VAAAREALAHARDDSAAGLVVRIPVDIDVPAIRKRVGLTQKAFAERFGFDLRSVQNWEQGRRVPTGPARVLLTMIAREPETVRRMLEDA
jgi:putative transcriptional regulator